MVREEVMDQMGVSYAKINKHKLKTKEMKKLTVFALTGVFVFAMGDLNAQSLKDRLKKKLEGATSGKYKEYDYSDESGISGTYFTNDQIIDRQNTIGFKYTREEDGEIINKLWVDLGGKGYGNRTNSITMTLKEKYERDYDFKYFYLTDKDVPKLVNNSDVFAFMEIADDVYAFAQEDKVLCVAAKDSAQFSEYDTETAQVLFDMNMAKANKEAMDKETDKWMKNELFAKHVGKMIFGVKDYHLVKRGVINKPPQVNGKDFKTVLDMSKDMHYSAYLKYPIAEQYPGAEINVEFEMNGIKTSRTDLKSKSAKWSKSVKRLEAKDFNYRQLGPRQLRAWSDGYRAYVQDYAFMYLLYQNKDNFEIGKEYPLTVRMYTSRDGENMELITEGTVNLLFSAEAYAHYVDPEEADEVAIFDDFEAFLDE